MAALLTEPDVSVKEIANSRHPHISQMGSSPKSLRAMTRQEGRDVPVIKSSTSRLREIIAVLGEKNAIQRSEQEQRKVIR